MPAPVGLVSRFLTGEGLDPELLGDWILALGLIDWRDGHSEPHDDGVRHDGDLLLFGLFRPIFHECPRRIADWLPEDARPALARRVLNLIQFGQWEESFQAARAYYRAAGRHIVNLSPGRPSDDNFPARLAAALLAPLNDHDIRRGLGRWIVPEKVSPR